MKGTVALKHTDTDGDGTINNTDVVKATFTNTGVGTVNTDYEFKWIVNGTVDSANTTDTYNVTSDVTTIVVEVVAKGDNVGAPAKAITAELKSGVPTPTATIADLTYTGQTQTPTITFDKGATADDFTVTYEPGEVKNAGSYTAKFASKDADKFGNPADATFAVAKADLTLSVKADATANASGWTLDDVAGSDAKGSDTLADIFGAVTVAGDPAVYKDAHNIVTLTFYEEVPEVPAVDCTCPDGTHDDTNPDCPKADAIPAHYEKITAAPAAGKTYYVDIAVAANTADLTNYNSVAKTAGVPTAGTLAQFTKVTFAAAPSTSGGGVSNNFTVTYNAGAHGALAAGAKSSEQVKRNESPKNVPAVVANAGYAFIGWTADGKTLVNPAAQTITKNTTFTAVYGDHLNYMVGRSVMEFVPDGNLTRAEAAAILSRLTEGFEEDGTYPAAPYSDLVAGAWYVKYVNFAADKGIVNGRTDGTFDPDANITRAEFATMIANFAKIAPVDTAAVSTDVAGHWAEGYIAALEQAKIVTGYEDGTFKPNNSITRAEAATMVNGAIGRVPMTGLDLSVNGYDNPFVDVNESQWFYGQVMEATVDHVTAHFHK